ncbi:LPXTG cell wall anchor domain-containing protein [Streptomyces sp. NPDC058864]
MSLPKRKAAAVSTAVAVTAAAAVLGSAPAAYAKVVDVKYDCKTPIGDKSAVSPIDITATKSGSGYRIVMSFRKGVSSSPVDLGKGAMNPSALITLGGADRGSLKASGPANAETVPANTPIKINDLSGSYVPRGSGKVTFTAGVLTIKALGTTTTCTPGNGPGPSLTLDVTAAAGSKGGSASSGSGGSGGSGGQSLPQTGPEDGAVALGTLGGTVLLLGAAGVLWLTRRPDTRI